MTLTNVFVKPITSVKVKEGVKCVLECRNNTRWRWPKSSTSPTLTHQGVTNRFCCPLGLFQQLFKRLEIQILVNKKFLFDGTKVHQAWLYYFPRTNILHHKIHNEFFHSLFPEPTDLINMESVGDQEHTEILSIALHDKVFDDDENTYVIKSLVISSISFRLLFLRILSWNTCGRFVS